MATTVAKKQMLNDLVLDIILFGVLLVSWISFTGGGDDDAFRFVNRVSANSRVIVKEQTDQLVSVVKRSVGKARWRPASDLYVPVLVIKPAQWLPWPFQQRLLQCGQQSQTQPGVNTKPRTRGCLSAAQHWPDGTDIGPVLSRHLVVDEYPQGRMRAQYNDVIGDYLTVP